MAVEGAPAGLLDDWRVDGSGDKKRIGVLLVHGFTGSPASMRPWGEYLHQRGYTVTVPLLPGHGTTPHDLNRVKWQEWPAKVLTCSTTLFRTTIKVQFIRVYPPP